MKKYIISDHLQKFIDWTTIMPLSRNAGGHDEQMQGLFRGATVIGHYNSGDYQGQVATCVQLPNGMFAIYNDYYGTCSGCDAWEEAGDESVKAMCIDLANGAYLFEHLDDVKEFLTQEGAEGKYGGWGESAPGLLESILTEEYLKKKLL